MKGIIYKITNLNNNKIYIGSTIQKLKRRFQHHISRQNEEFITPMHIDMCASSNPYEEFTIEALKEYDLNIYDIGYMRKEEGEFIKLYNSTNPDIGYNLRIEKRTNKEWYNQNKERIIEKSKNYYYDNKDKIKEYAKNYYSEHKQKIKEEYIKKKENYKIYNNSYYEQNKERILKKKEIKYICDCCVLTIRKDWKNKHNISTRHVNNERLYIFSNFLPFYIY